MRNNTSTQKATKGSISTWFNLLKAIVVAASIFAVTTSSAQVTLTVSQGTNAASVQTGNEFIDTIKYQCSSLTSSGQNAVTTLQLPANLVPFATSPLSVVYDKSQVASVKYDSLNSLITVTYVNPLPGGSSGYLTIGFAYLNGLTPNGYTPNIIASINATNFQTATNILLGPIYDTVSVAAIATNNYYIQKAVIAGGAINDSTIYKLSIGQNNGGVGSLNLINPTLVDTLPLGASFVSATAFGGSYPPVYNASKNTITWSWGTKGTDTSWSGYNSSAYVTVTYDNPNFTVGQNVCNHATISGFVPKLPIGTDSSVASSGSVCETLILPQASVECTGGEITAATYPWFIDNYVFSGTKRNTFSNGWKNEGNTSLSEVDLTYSIDKSVDMDTIRINPVKDVFDSVTTATIQVSYTTNLNNNFSTPVSYQSLNIPNGTKLIPTLGSNEYLTQVMFKVTGNLPLGSSESMTYYGNVRTALTGAKDGSTITEGAYADGDKGTPPATLISNTSTGMFIYNGDTTKYSSCSNKAEIIFAQPAFHDSYKSITNGSAFDASDTVNYQFNTYLGGNASATNVVVSDTLDSRLAYVVGSSTFTIGNGTATNIIPDTTRSSKGLLILTYHLGTIAPGSDYYINFNALIPPATAPGTIWNKFTLNSNNALFNTVTDSVNLSILSAAAVRVYKGQNGCDKNYVYYPNIAAAQGGGPVNYKITIKNLGNIVADSLVLVDVFPFINDYRGSQWYANMASPAMVSNPNYTVYYTTVSNPCYSDFSPAPSFSSNCNTPSWSNTLPTNITTVTAIKLANFTTPIKVLDSVVLTWPMVAPVGVPQPPSGANLVMNNSVTYQVNTGGVRLLPSTPNMVGMNTSCIPVNGSIGNYVWIDSNRNGIQDEPANLGLNGVRVYLYQNTGSGFVKVDSSITANDWSGNPGYYKFVDLQSGQYYVNFPVAYNGDSLTKVVNQTVKTDFNSDANTVTGNSEIVTINTASSNPQDVNNTTIDAGYVPYGSLGNYVWNDLNNNGLQDDGATSGINGVKVYLYENTKNGFVKVDSTITADSAGIAGYPGYYNFIIDSSTQYKVLFPTMVGTKTLTIQDTTLITDGNSNAYPSTGFSNVVVMNNFITAGLNKDNPTIDAGYVCNVQRPVVTVAGSPQLCDTYSTILTATDTTANPVYTWYKAGSQVAGSIKDTLHTSVAGATPSPAGTYWVTTTDASGCISNNSDTITVSTVGTIAGSAIACMNSTITLTNPTSGGVWGSSNTAVATISATGVVTPVTAGTTTISYVVTNVTNNCSTTKTKVITVDTVPVVQPIVATTSALCAGGSTSYTTTLTDATSSNGTHTWTSSSTSNATVNSSTGVVTGVKAGTVTITYAFTNTYGCKTSVTTPITINPLPTVAAITGTTTVCRSSITTLADATSGGVWSSANNTYATVDATGNVTGVAKGTDVITYTYEDGNNCTSSKTATVTINDVPVVAAITGTASVCAGSTTTLSDATSGGSWSTSDNTTATVSSGGVVSGVKAGTATISYTVTNGCGPTTVTQLVTVNALPIVASITGTASVCVNSTTTLSDATTGGSWTTSDNTIATVTSAGIVKGIKAGTANITYTVTNSNGCTSSVSQSIIVNALPTVSAITGANVCVGSTSTLNDITANGVWSSFDNTTASISSTGVVTGVKSGSVTISYTVTNSNGCTTTATKSVTVYALPTVAAITGTTSVCAGLTTKLSDATTGGSWTSSDNTTATVSSTGVVTGVQAGSATIYYSVTNSNGCTTQVSIPITVNALPTVAAITGTASVCAGLTTNLADATVSGSWTSSDNTIATVSSTGVVTGVKAGAATISYTVTNSNGCTTSATQLVTVNALPVTPVIATKNNQTTFCKGSSLVLTSTAATTYQWFLNDVSVAASTQNDTVITSGTYKVVVTNSAGCISDTSLPITVDTVSVKASFVLTDSTVTNTPCLSGNSIHFTNTSYGATAYQWFSDDSLVSTLSTTADTTYTTANTYFYTLVVSNSIGCTDTLTQPIYVYSCSVSSGGTGGLESKSLGAAIGTRNFNLYKNGKNGAVTYNAKEMIASTRKSVGVMGLNNGTSFSLSSTMPSYVSAAYTAYDKSSAVTDLESITNAVDIRAIDFTLNNSPKAVAFATKTVGGIYSHTKPICDRLKGAQLLNVENVQIQNITFIRYTIQQTDGSTEYAISFSAGEKVGRNSYSIQSNWLMQDYVGEDTMINYQLWAASPVDVKSMVTEILSKLQANMPLVQNNSNDLPGSYVSAVNRQGTNLNLTINNRTANTTGYFQLTQRATEITTSGSTLVVPFTISANAKSIVSIPVSDNYDADIKIVFNNVSEDYLYMADGIWGTSTDNTTSNLSLSVSNDASRVIATNEYALLRNVKVQATTSSYVSVYKFLKGGGVSANLNGNKTFKFTTSANTAGLNLRITIAKQGIANWNSQYSYLISNLQDGQTYEIGLSQFKSTDGTLPTQIDLSDVTTVNYAIEVASGQATNINVGISNASFTTEDILYERSLQVTTLNVSPNPNNGIFKVSFVSPSVTSLRLSIVDLTGKILSSQTVNAVVGKNNVGVQLNQALDNSVYFISLQGSGVKYDTQRAIIKK